MTAGSGRSEKPGVGRLPRARFILATGNRHKVREYAAILAPCRVDAMPAGVELPPEGEESFAANALDKAEALARTVCADPTWLTGMDLRPDDSGLEVEALGWAPGVVSARYAGVDGAGADRANCERLLGELRGVAGPPVRRARFVCAVVAVTSDMTHHAARGEWWGTVAETPRGEGGFGYDPVFVPEGSNLSVAQWPQEAKDRASHRALAGRSLIRVLRKEGLLHGC